MGTKGFITQAGIIPVTPLVVLGLLVVAMLVVVTSQKARNDEYSSEVQAAQTFSGPVSTDPVIGYSRIRVPTDRGTFAIDVIRQDVGSGVKVITDSGNTTDCGADCITMPLADYVRRNGGFAGINGTYFCPPDYGDCAAKKNSFHWFVFNYIAKTFLNADKRDYSNAGGAFVFRPGSIQFFRDPRAFGLDTSITGAIASWPTLVAGGQIVLDENVLDAKQRNAKGNRGGLGHIGNQVFLIVARGASIPDLAAIMQALHIEDGVNLDGGGSSAMWYGGYKAGPGRKLPNAIILIQ